jgi:hypothetical protein
MLSPVVNPDSMTIKEGADLRYVDEYCSNQSDPKLSSSMQLSLETASKVWSKAALKNVCVVSSKKLPGIFSKVN